MTTHYEKKKFDALTEERIDRSCLKDLEQLHGIVREHSCDCHPRLDKSRLGESIEVLGTLALILHDELMTLEASMVKMVKIDADTGEHKGSQEHLVSRGTLVSLMTVLAYAGDSRCRKVYAQTHGLLPSNVTAMRTDYCVHTSANKEACTLLGVPCTGLKFDCPAYRTKST